MATKRKDFSDATKKIIAMRAGFRCSFPGCDSILVSPGYDSDKVLRTGECAHIYAAAGGGLRANSNLSEKEIESPENGIFLCQHHHAIVIRMGKLIPQNSYCNIKRCMSLILRPKQAILDIRRFGSKVLILSRAQNL